MASFSLPPINDNPDGGWGPSTSNLPAQFKFRDIPYAPYSKSDKLGRFADWNDISGDNRPNVGVAAQGGTRGGGPGARGRRDGQPAFGSGAASAFAYFHAEDESSFSVVDNRANVTRRGGALGRGRNAGRGGASNRGASQRGGRGGFSGGRGGNAQRGGGGRRGWKDWKEVLSISTLHFFLALMQTRQNHRTRESSVAISPEWQMLEEIEFHRLSKLRLEVDEPEDLCVFVHVLTDNGISYLTRGSYGKLFPYDKSYDRITTKSERPLQLLDRIRYNTTTSDDPVISEVCKARASRKYSLLMRSSFDSWHQKTLQLYSLQMSFSVASW